MELKQSLQHLRNWIQVAKQSFLLIKIIEVLCVVGIGYSVNIISGNRDSNVSFWEFLLLLSAIIYGVIGIFQAAFTYNFPVSITEEITSKISLQAAQEQLQRKNGIYLILSETVNSLNNATCSIQDQNIEDLLCNNPLKENLNTILLPLTRNINNIFNCYKGNFYIGIYLEAYMGKPEKDATGKYISQNSTGTVGIFNELFQEDLPEDLITLPDAKGIDLSIKHLIEKSIKNEIFVEKEINENGINLKAIAVEIDEVCEGLPAKGVLFVLSDQKECFPNDVSSLLKFFANIISNTVAKQNECITNKLEKLNTTDSH